MTVEPGRVEGADRAAACSHVVVQPQLGHRLVGDQHRPGGPGRVDEPRAAGPRRPARRSGCGSRRRRRRAGARRPAGPAASGACPSPASPSAMATGTSRAPASRISWRMLAYEGDSTAMRSPRPAKRWQMASMAPIAPGGDHDLLGHGRDAARGVPVGEHRAQRGQARPGSRRGCGRTAAAPPARPGRPGSARARARAGPRSRGRSSSRAASGGSGFESAGGQRVPGRVRRSSCPRRAGTPGTPRRAAPRRRRRRSYG